MAAGCGNVRAYLLGGALCLGAGGRFNKGHARRNDLHSHMGRGGEGRSEVRELEELLEGLLVTDGARALFEGRTHSLDERTQMFGGREEEEEKEEKGGLRRFCLSGCAFGCLERVKE